SFGGIGAEVGIRNDVLTVISPLEGNPAQAMGLKPGDKILKIDDTLSSELSLDESVEAIRGEPGTKVRLLISRDDWKEAKEIVIIRAEIKIPIIKWEIIDNNIAHIQLYQFTENAAGQFEKTIKEIQKSNVRGIILDLRNNPGGYLEVAVDIASRLLSKGDLVVVEDFGNGETSNKYYSEGYQGIQDLPMVVLINEGSASASEILAGALRDDRGIKIIGEKSFGKGSVQQLEKLRGGASIKITVAKWLTPSGATIEGEGITPDIEVKLTEDDINNMKDSQLDRALETLKELFQ
ncbi:S41 family peptidase, partial [Patescibacteria group bacterium]|nr:S41 family peptidase [Patescibacteria group bacterium]